MAKKVTVGLIHVLVVQDHFFPVALFVEELFHFLVGTKDVRYVKVVEGFIQQIKDLIFSLKTVHYEKNELI